MVVYGILSTRSDTQFVRIYSTYNPSGYNPLSNTTENQITDAQVSIAAGDSVISLRDTTLVRPDKSRYTSDLRLYYAYPLKVQRGKAYVLTVASPSLGTATATATVMTNTYVTVLDGSVLETPLVDGQISVQLYLGANAQGYLVRFYLEYSALISNVIQTQRVEVPLSIQLASDSLHYENATTMTLAYRGQNPYLDRDGVEIIGFPSIAYITILRQLRKQFPDSLKVKKAVFVLTQLDQNLYGYYNVVNGFPDSFTLRVDEPDYSNVQGGLGIFGVMTEDNFSIVLPDKIKLP
jgi:hypothetical protein